MFFKSEKKVLKNLILEVIAEKTPEYLLKSKEVKENSELDEAVREMELDVIKKRHLDDVLNTVIDRVSLQYPDKGDSIHYMVMDPSYCGYDLDLNEGVMAGGIYAICHFAVTNKVAAASDCADLNSRHARMMAQAMM